LTEEAIKLSIQDTDATDGKKKKKKIVKKKKEKEEKKEVKAPEITSGLRNMVSQIYLKTNAVILSSLFLNYHLGLFILIQHYSHRYKILNGIKYFLRPEKSRKCIFLLLKDFQIWEKACDILGKTVFKFSRIFKIFKN
jgi:hypothetical protein